MDTIFVLNSNKQVIDILSNNGSNPSAPFFDDTYTSELDTGSESYEFTTINNPRTNITLEVGNYVLFKYNGKYKLFQIMETEDEHSEGKKLLTVYAEIAGMELLNDYCEPFSVEGNFITLLDRILQDTNWRVGLYSASLLDNIQSISYSEPKNVYSIIQENLSTFGGVEVEFRVEFVGNQLVAMLIDCYESGTRGNRTHRRFEYGKDVKGITRNRNINDLATAVIGQGNNGVTFKDIEWNKNWGNPCDKPLQQDFVVDIEANDLWNNGGKYIKTVHKVDTDDPQTLLQECWDYLQEIKQPKFDYDVDLALVAEDYMDIGVGDTNYVLDFDYQPAILLEARVGKLELSFADPRDNKCTLTNYKELVSILQQQPIDLNTVGNMIQSHFPIQGEDIAMGAIGEGHINVTYYQAIKTDIMSATLAEVGTLIADKADIKDLTAINANIENLRANKAEITDLTATNANITNLKAQVGNIETLISGNATTGDLQTIHLTAANTTIDNALIKNAMIDTISANKINTGTLNTNNVVIQSDDGGIVLSGSTQQFKDKEGHVRVQIGKDASGNFTFCLFSQDGVGILLDETGIKAGAVPDGLIVNDMVSDSANISGSKLDISSVITQINNNETTINSSHIKFDDTGQSLLVAFNQLKNTVDTIEEVTISGDLSSVIEKVNTHTTQIGVIQGQISSLISNTTITKEDGTVTQLKDEYNSTKTTVDSHTSKIGSLETNYNKVSGDLVSVTSKQSTLEQNLDEVSSTLTSTTTTANSALNKATAAQQNLDGFKTTVSNTYTTKTDFNNLSIGGRNLAQKTSSDYSPSFSNFSGETNRAVVIGRVLTDGLTVGDTVTVKMVYKYTDIVPTDGQTATCRIQGAGDVTSWSAGSFKSSDKKTISGSGEHIFNYNFTITADHLLNSYWRVELRHNYVQSGSITWKMFKVEKGNKATDWSPAPEDIDNKFTNYPTTEQMNSAITQKANEITSSVETNLSNNYATKSLVTQTADSVTSIFSQSGAYNLIYNGNFKNELNNWTLSGPNLTYFNTDYEVTPPNSNVAARIYGTIGKEASLKQSVDVFTDEAITVSYWMFTSSVGVDGIEGKDGTTNPFRNLQMIITYTDDTTDVFDISSLQANIDEWEKFTFTAYPTSKTKAIEIGLYNRDTSRALLFSNIMVEYGVQATRFTPNPNEITDGIVRADRNGITVLQGNNKSVLDSEALKFYEGTVPYSRIEGGALEFTDTLGARVGRMGRYIFSESGAYVNMLQSYYGQATAIGAIKKSSDTAPTVNYISSSIDTMLSSKYYIKQGGNIFQTWVHNQLWFRPYSKYDYAYPGGVISTYDNADFNIHGNDNLHLGILAGMEMKTGLSIVEDSTAANGCHIKANGPFDMGGFAIYNGVMASSLEAQSTAVYSARALAEKEGTTDPYANDICEIYSTNSLTNGEIRWTDRETYSTTPDIDDETKYTCYVEIPYYMAENIEENYHVSITPISFGQYRVAERNPYYFIVESLEDDFMFTFEVVAKKIEKSDINNVVVANQQYTPTVEDQTGTGLYIDQ